MAYLRGRIKIGIKDVNRDYISNYNLVGYVQELNDTFLKEKTNAKLVFVNNSNFYFKNNDYEQTFDEIMEEITNENKSNKKERNIIATTYIDYFAKINEKNINLKSLDKKIRSIFENTSSCWYTNKNIKILKHTYRYKTPIDILDELVNISPSLIKSLYTDLISEKDTDILANSMSQYKIKKKEISKIKLNKEEVLKKFKYICKNDNLKEEINRIFQIKDFRNIQGVNYLFNEENPDLREKTYDVLASALYSSGRLANPYYFKIEIDVHEKDIRPLLVYLQTRLKISRNEFYVFEFANKVILDDPFSINGAYCFTSQNESFFKILKENQYTNTFSIYVDEDAKFPCESLQNKNLVEKYSFVEFTNKLNKEAQIQYAKEKLNKYNQMDLLPKITEIIEYQSKQYDGLTTAELDEHILSVFKSKYEKVYRPVYKNATKDMSKGDVFDKLMNMVGLENFKNAVKELCNKVNFKNLNDELVPATKALNQVTNFERNNWILTGVPGTGKSVAAEILEKIMFQEKIIKKDLIVKYTPSKRNNEDSGISFIDLVHMTANDIEDSFIEAAGGVLVVDEIGHLSNQDKSLLLQLMEDNKRSVSVILCGYENEAKDLLDFNPGFRSRFTHIINMEEYTTTELYQILVNKMGEKNFSIKDDLKDKMYEIITNLKAIPNFGQARFIESLADKLIGIHSSKKLKLIEEIVKKDLKTNISKEEIFEIDEEDVDSLPLDEMTGNEYSLIIKHKDAYNELHNLIGCETVKNSIDEFVYKSQVDKMKIERKLIDRSSLNMNMVFYGSPGTAKTTVARLVAKIMYNKGIINTPKITEVGASDLVGEFVGQTAPKTVNVFKKAKGGVLFIDEAYTLANSRAGGYNQEAIDTIIKEMENCRNNTMVIFAGYKNKMEEFIKCNPGFRSRISKFIDFPNYSREELIKIFIKLVNDNGYKLDKNKEKTILSKIGDYLEEKMNDADFGNGRVCRTILENAINKQSKRIINSNKEIISNEELMTLKNEDFSFATIDFNSEYERIGFLAA